MDRSVKRIAVTGGAGQIAYSLLFRIAHGDLFGPEQPVALRLLDIPEALSALEGVRMELEDCAFPLLREIRIGSDPEILFEEVDVALLVGAKPRGPGMERSDLLAENGKIFIEHGKALNRSASKEALVLVVGNPCNTNCLIAMHHAPELNRKNFHAMTRLDQNRAKALLARKALAEISEVTRVIIWGNHSSTQVPDFRHALVRGHSVAELIADRRWLERDFVEIVRKRGAEIIKARGKSSAASAAHAAVDAVRDLVRPQEGGEWFSSGVCSEGNPYGVREDLIFSFPCRSLKEGRYELVEGLDWDDFLEERIRASEKELVEELDAVKELLKGG